MSDFTKFEKIKIGDTAVIEKNITEADVKKFVQMTGDDNPLHVDPRYAETTSFKGIVVHGMLGASFISTIIGTKLPGEGALWVSQNFDFLLPVRLGDRLKISAEVIKKYEKDQLIELYTEIRNQNNAQVLKGSGKVKILEVENSEDAEVKPEDPKVAVVTGALGGIGQEICKKFLAQDYRVLAIYRTARPVLEELVEHSGGKLVPLQCDITEEGFEEKVLQAIKLNFGSASVLVNNASPKINSCKISDSNWSAFQQQIDVQVKASFNLIKAIAPGMKDHGGAIINISSQIIDGTPNAYWASYSMAKSALHSLTKFAAYEYGPMGVRVNQVSPGMTETTLIGDIPLKSRMIQARQAPLRKLALPTDVANAVFYLASKDSSHVTGETLRVNGGLAMV